MGTKIEWTDVTKVCRVCHVDLPLAAFGIDRSRADGRTYVCRECKNGAARDRYDPKPRPRPLRRKVAARDGDVRQARRSVNAEVERGRMPHPNALPCADCGHRNEPGGRRHEYDHHLGYAGEHHLHVEAVCTSCHRRREAGRLRRAA